jgi:hypothetical protein
VYPKARLEFLFQVDSTASNVGFVTSSAWASSGKLYYIYSSWEKPSAVWRLDTATRVAVKVAEGVHAPLAVATDERLACLDVNGKVVVLDSSGSILWRRELPANVTSLAFSQRQDGLYASSYDSRRPPGMILYVPFDDPFRSDTIVYGAMAFRVAPSETSLVYRHGSQLRAYSLGSGSSHVVMDDPGSSVFDVNPVVQQWLAVGQNGDGYWGLVGRRAQLRNIQTGDEKIRNAYPFDNCEVTVAGWSPNGADLLLNVARFIGGDPMDFVTQEFWVARNILE